MTADALPGLRRVEHVMGMPILVDVRDELVDARTLDSVFAWLRRVDATLSTYQDGSEISRLGRGELVLADAHPEVRAVLERCEGLRAETDGYFDVRAVSRLAIDPSGFVRGWSVDRAAELLDGAGARNYAVNAGGDIRLRGAAVPPAGASESSTRSSATASPAWSRAPTSRSPLRASTSAARTSSTRTAAGRRGACSRSRSPGRCSRRPTPMRPPPSRWGRPGRPGRRPGALDARLPRVRVAVGPRRRGVVGRAAGESPSRFREGVCPPDE